jgi:hypothetical protein
VPHELPVFLLATAAADLGPEPEEEAQALVVDAGDGPTDRMLYDTSTSWWRAELAKELARAWAVPGLDFLADPVVLLSSDQAAVVAAGAQAVLERLKVGPVPRLTGWFGPEFTALETADVAALLQGCSPQWRGAPDDPDVESFLGFLLALSQISQRAADSKVRLLYYRPQP